MSASKLNNPELVELIQDTAEYIRYLKTLGVSHLGGAADIPVDIPKPAPRTSLVSSQPALLPAEHAAELPPVLPVEAPQSEPVSVETESLPVDEPPPVTRRSLSVSEPVEAASPLLPVESEPMTQPAAEITPAPPEPSESVSPELAPEIPTMRLIKVTPTAPAKTTAKSKPQASLFDMFGAEPEPPAPEPEPEPAAQDTCLQDIRDEIGDCQRCKLATGRHHIVFGDGNPNARLVFVGEAPGADEDASGVPFVGRAGQLLNKIIEAIGMKREDVYICNVVKCRPPENRTPERDEIDACQGFLHRQLAIIKPKIIVSLGAPAAFTLLGDSRIGRISEIRGNFYDYRGTPLMITFHPAYLLRTPEKKREVWEDMKKVRAFLRGELKLE